MASLRNNDLLADVETLGTVHIILELGLKAHNDTNQRNSFKNSKIQNSKFPKNVRISTFE